MSTKSSQPFFLLAAKIADKYTKQVNGDFKYIVTEFLMGILCILIAIYLQHEE